MERAAKEGEEGIGEGEGAGETMLEEGEVEEKVQGVQVKQRSMKEVLDILAACGDSWRCGYNDGNDGWSLMERQM